MPNVVEGCNCTPYSGFHALGCPAFKWVSTAAVPQAWQPVWQGTVTWPPPPPRLHPDDIETIVERTAQRVSEMRRDFGDEEKTAEHLPNTLAIREKLDEQIAISRAAYGCDPPRLYLTGADYDLWCAADSRAQHYYGKETLIPVVLLEEAR